MYTPKDIDIVWKDVRDRIILSIDDIADLIAELTEMPSTLSWWSGRHNPATEWKKFLFKSDNWAKAHISRHFFFRAIPKLFPNYKIFTTFECFPWNAPFPTLIKGKKFRNGKAELIWGIGLPKVYPEEYFKLIQDVGRTFDFFGYRTKDIVDRCFIDLKSLRYDIPLRIHLSKNQRLLIPKLLANEFNLYVVLLRFLLDQKAEMFVKKAYVSGFKATIQKTLL